MHTFAEKAKETQQTMSAESTTPRPTPFGQRHEANKNPNLQRTTSHSGFDFSRIPVHSSVSDHDANQLHRHAAGPGPATAPAIVHDVLRGPGRPIPADVRRDIEALLGHDFAD